jgi:hypothetical protein
MVSSGMLHHVALVRMVSSGMLHRVALVRTNVSEELSACIIRVTGISELGTMLASNQRTLRRNTNSKSKSLCISSQRALVASYS